MYTKNDIKDQLKKIGITQSDTVIIHTSFKAVGEIAVPQGRAVALSNLFASCGLLESVQMLTVTGQTTFSGTFNGCKSLKEIRFSGNVANDIDLHWSVALSRSSIENVYYAALGGSMDHGAYPTLTFSLTAVNAAFESAAGANDGSESAAWQALVDQAPFTISLI